MMKRLHSLASTLLAVLREIFDESAYARFLERNAMSASPASYAGFLGEDQVQKLKRPRCC